jgi:hypothetical protein
VVLSFNWQALGETDSYDALMVSVAPTSQSITGSTSGLGTSGLSAPITTIAQYWGLNSLQTATLRIPASLINNCNAASTIRLIFTWKNDGSGGTNPPAAIDNISLVSQAPRISGSGTFTIDQTLPNTGSNFNTFAEAVAQLNAACPTGPITFNVSSGQTFNEEVPVITATGSAANPIVFQKAGGGANPIIRSVGTSGTADAGITIQGGDYFTFDGIDIAIASGSALEYGYYIRNASATNGASNNTIRNASITLNRNNTNSRGILQNVVTTPSAASGSNSNNRYHNLTIRNVYSGIQLTGNSSFPDDNTEIGAVSSGTFTIGDNVSNDIGNGSNTAWGIRATSQRSMQVFGATVRNVTVTSSSTTASGIWLENTQGTSAVFGNRIHDIRSTSTATSAILYGIRGDATATNTVNVYNNFIYGFAHAITTASATQVIRALAINVGSSGIANVTYNSVRIEAGTAASSAAFYVGAGTASARNNIFSSFSTGAATSKRHVIYISTSATLSSNYNDLYTVSGTNNFIGGVGTTDYAAFSGTGSWQTITGTPDLNSVNVDPLFFSATDLHTENSALNALATPTTVPTITVDIDGQTRNATTPDIGADEFDPPTTPCVAPANQATALTGTSVTATGATVSYTAAASAPTGYLVVRSTAALSGNPADGTTYTTGTALGGGTVVFVGTALTFPQTGLTANTTYTYTVFAYNNTGCVGGPVYNVTAPLSGTVTTCVAQPTALTTSAVTTSGFTLSWTAPAGPAAVTYTVDVATENTFTNIVFNQNVSTTNVTVGGLNAGTVYFYRVRAENGSCNAGFTTPASVATACNPVAIPLNQGFNSTSLPICWSRAIAAVQTATKISFVASGSSPTTSPFEGSHFVQYNSFSSTNGGAGSEERLISPALITTGTSSVDVEFQWRNDNNTSYSTGAYLNEGVQVQYSIDGGTTWVDAGFFARHDATLAAGTAQWKKKTVTLPAAAGNQANLLVAFKFRSEFGDNMFLDDVQIKATPACAAPNNVTIGSVTATTASVSFTCATCTGSYIVEYGPTGFTPGTGASAGGGTVVTGAASPIALSGLTAVTAYQVYVRQDCGGGVYSANSGVVSFTTTTPIMTVPYTQDFEGAITEWTLGTAGQTNRWFRGTAANNGGTQGLYISNTSGSTNAYSTSSESMSTAEFRVDLTGLTAADLKFDWRANGETSWDYGEVYINTGSGDVRISNSGEFRGSTAFATRTISLNAYVGGVVTIKFRWTNDDNGGSQQPMAIDNVSVTVPPTCSGTPNAGTTAAGTSTFTCTGSTTLSLTGASSGVLGLTYQWQSSPDGTNWTDIASATSVTYAVSGLLTTTQFRAVVTCSANNESASSTPVTLTVNAPTAGTVVAPAVACSGNNFTLSLTGNTTSNITYQWQSSTDGSNWTNVATGGTSSTYTANQTAATYYRAVITCTANNANSVNTPGVLVGMNALPCTYCSPLNGNTLHSSSSNQVTNVSLSNTTLNSSNGVGSGGYTAVQPTPSSNTATVQQTATYTLTAALTGSPTQVAAWIDYNASGTFETTEYVAMTITGSTATASITIPGTATLGNTVMRIRTRGATFTNANACLSFSSGETEDYLITIDGPPACPAPSGVTAGSVTASGASISFTSGGSSFIVEYGPTGFTPGTGSTAGTNGTVVTGAASPIALTGLAANTTYQVYVRQDCSGTISANSTVVSFTTPCAAVNLPYVEDFSSAVLPAIPNCTAREDVNSDGRTWTTVNAVTGYTGNLLQYSFSSSIAANDWFYTAGLNLTAGQSYVLSYRFGNNSVSSFTERMRIAIGGSAANASMTTMLAEYPTVNGSTPRVHYIRFTVPATGVYYIGFQAYSTANQWFLYLDDISVREAGVAPGTVNTCVTASPLTIDATNNNKWMALVDGSGNVIGEINANGNNLGALTTKVYVHSGAVRADNSGRYYLDRNVEITPATQPTSAVDVKLYFTAAELAALAAQNGSAVSNANDLRIYKNSDVCGEAIRVSGAPIASVNTAFGSNYVAAFSTGSFSSFYFASISYSALPVSLTSFSGTRSGSNNILRWTTAGESNNLGFHVERSTDGVSFAPIGFVRTLAPNGSSTAAISYTFTDQNVSGEKHLYRLRQVDTDGRARHSGIVTIKSQLAAALTFSGLYPNPARDRVNLSIESPSRQRISMVVTDLAGKVVLTKEAIVETGANTVPLPTAALASGTYMIRLACNSGCESAVMKLIKE